MPVVLRWFHLAQKAVPVQHDDERLYDRQEACTLLRISRSSLHNQLAAGALTAVRFGRRTLFTHSELMRWIRALPAARPAPDREPGGPETSLQTQPNKEQKKK